MANLMDASRSLSAPSENRKTTVGVSPLLDSPSRDDLFRAAAVFVVFNILGREMPSNACNAFCKRVLQITLIYKF